mmetsp:Transcript_13961/g.23217  ORF Transcript_13961/g.23217 Transcript_13961/m.23217 type:complete len:83 (-) Transcript_13961:1792-2040(-)
MDAPEVKTRLEKIESNAKAKIAEVGERRDANYYKRTGYVPREPIFIASTEDIGSMRVRANHIDAAIHYCIEQENLKAAGAPI